MKVLSKKQKKDQGFTLLELLVVMAIFIILTTVVLFGQNNFSSNTALTNLTYEIALQIRQAQSYGLQVHNQNASSTVAFDTGYGIHIPVGNVASSTTTFSLFADADNSHTYNAGRDGKTISTFTLREGDIISDVCVMSGVTTRCFSSSSVPMTNSVDIVFKRPDPAAIIIDTDNSNPPATTSDYEVDITVMSALKNKTKVIKVLSTGAISVQ